MAKYRVYALVDPENNEYRYIGRTKNPDARLKAHLLCKVPATMLWISKLDAKGLKPVMIILEEFTMDWQSRRSEKEWISKSRDMGCDLLNLR